MTVTALLEIRNLSARVEEREILHGLSLTVNKGEVHAIMGPNGSGKSTLSHVLACKPGYEVTGGEVRFNGEDLLAMEPDIRAAKGVFLAFQYPVEIPGVATMTFLRAALNAQRKARGEAELSTPEFMKKVKEVAGRLGIAEHFDDIFDIVAAAHMPKPYAETYDKFLGKTGIDPKRSAMFEDLPRNLIVPHDLGMRTVLVGRNLRTPAYVDVKLASILDLRRQVGRLTG